MFGAEGKGADRSERCRTGAPAGRVHAMPEGRRSMRRGERERERERGVGRRNESARLSVALRRKEGGFYSHVLL
jgi:hypothetical protein